MSLIAIQGGVTGTGTVSIVAPSTSTNRTISLPDATGTMLTDQSDILTQTKAALNASNGAPIYACRAWVNFNGTGTVAIRASGNVSSITDNGAGDYTVNFTTAMPDTNYSAVANTGDVNTPGNQGRLAEPQTVAAGSIRIIAYGSSFTRTDTNLLTVAIFR